MISTNELGWCPKHHCKESFFGSTVIASSHFSGDEAIQKSDQEWIASSASRLLAMTFWISLIIFKLSWGYA